MLITPYVHHFYTKFFNTMQKGVKYTYEVKWKN